MADLKYPREKEAEIPGWLQIKIHSVTKTNDQPESEEMGEKLHTIEILSPQAIIENNTANYASTDFKISKAFSSMKDATFLESLKGAGMGFLKEGAGGFGAEVERMTSQIVNPRSEQFFTGPGFRQFTFHWELAPLTAGDATELENIYKTIRKSTYPKIIAGSAGSLYGMPDEFKIAWVDFESNDLDSQPKFGRCVCTNISINYTGAGIAAVASSGGAPPFVNLDITFAERTLLHQGSGPIT